VDDAAPRTGAMMRRWRGNAVGGILCFGADRDRSRCVIVRSCRTQPMP